MKLLAKNRRATFDYELTERLIAGVALTGDEVKSIKAGHASLKGSFIGLYAAEAYLINAHVTPYAKAFRKTSLDATRGRKLLLHRKQLEDLITRKQSGLSVVPTALLQDRGFIKVEIAIGRGKKRYDKREALKKRDTTREIARTLKR